MKLRLLLPLALAAESYGWEAKAEHEQSHDDKSARFYLTPACVPSNSHPTQ